MDILIFMLSLSAATVVTDIDGTYIDVGVALSSQDTYRTVKTTLGAPAFITDNPLATYEVGYQKGRHKLFFVHETSVRHQDFVNGENKIGYAYRVWRGGSRNR